MALWNDKRTPPGVVTDTGTGQLGRMGAGATRGGFTPFPPPPPAQPVGQRAKEKIGDSIGRPDSEAVTQIKREAATKAGKRTGAFATPKRASNRMGPKKLL